MLRRLKLHAETMERQLATEVAKGIFSERGRGPTVIPAPVLPSPLQQELHAITHQPFAPWCQACLAGRSRQSPHKAEEITETQEEPQRAPMVIQLDYCYTFTKEKGAQPEEEGTETRAADDSGVVAGPQQPSEERAEGDEAPKPEKPDLRDQFGLNLMAAENTTGWVSALPLVAKGAASLKRVAEAMVRRGGDEVVVQGDPEPAMKQVLNSIEACRTKLGLKTQVRLTAKDSHQSNGVVEKGHLDYPPAGPHFESAPRRAAEDSSGCPDADLLVDPQTRRVPAQPPTRPYPLTRWSLAGDTRGDFMVFGETCLFFRPTKYKGDVQWRKGIWVGTNERNKCHVVLTNDGAFETRSVRRLPPEQQWSPELVVEAKGLPWDYAGRQRRKKPLYTSTRVPLVPDTTTLEELARAAGRAAAESIAANTPVPRAQDEAGSDPTSSSSSTTTSSAGATPRHPPAAGEASGIAAAREATGGIAPAREAAGGIAPAREAAGGIATAGEAAAGIAAAREAGGIATASEATGGPRDMDTSSRATREQPEVPGPSVPKRPRLLLDRPPAGSPMSSSSLYLPGFAGISRVHGDVPLDEWSEWEEWFEDVADALDEAEAQWTEDGYDWEKPPTMSEEALLALDIEADRVELDRLLSMGVVRELALGEDTAQFSLLTTKMVRDWRKRPMWKRRSRLVAREFKRWSEWSQELFAPSSSLGTIPARATSRRRG